MSNAVSSHLLDLRVGADDRGGTGGRAGPAYDDEIEEMDRELAKVTKDFLRAVDVETLRVVKRGGEH